jgi:hypothetical protein
MNSFDPERQIAITWSVEDVHQAYPGLIDDQAFQVLQKVKHYHDACFGVNWETLEYTPTRMTFMKGSVWLTT